MDKCKLFTILLASLWLSGCSKPTNIQDLKNYVEQINARPPQALEEATPKIPSIALPEVKATGRDPFAPYINPETLAKRPDAGRPKEILENFPLDSLKMMGTVQEGNERWALIKSPDGLFRIKKGQYIGQNAGRVVKIDQTDMTIEELIPEGDNKWGKRLIKLNLNGSS
jgi:type IV pilus assembly protein PilP